MPFILKPFRVPAPFSERVGLFAFSRILDMGRPPPDVETGSPAALGLTCRTAAEMESLGEWLA